MKKGDGVLVNLGYVNNEYDFNGVRYFVGAKYIKPDFRNINNSIDLADCIENHLISGFSKLKKDEADGIISDEYACLTAGKED